MSEGTAVADTRQTPGGAGVSDVSDVPRGALIKYPGLRGVSLAFVLLGVMLHTIDSTIANVALPHMQGALSATIDQVTWVITSYIVAAAIMTPSVAWLSDRFGLKRVLIVSVLGFTVTSTMCGFAISLNDMVVYRFLQGASGAALIPIGQMVVLSSYPREDAAKAMAIFGLGVMLGPIIGPSLGGYITEVANWRWVFLINLPVGLAAAVGIALLVKEGPVSSDKYFDATGFFSLILAIGAFQFVMDQGHGEDWFESWKIIIWTVFTLLALYVFVVRTVTAKDPFFSRRLFSDRNFVASNVLFFAVMGNMVSTMVMIPVLMQSVMGYPALEAGIVLVPRGIGSMIGMALTPRLFARFDSRMVTGAGLLLTVVALIDQSHVSTFWTPWDFMRSGFVHGLGLGIVFVRISTLAYSTIPDQLLLQASTFFNSARNVGASFCASLAMSTLSRNVQINTAELGEYIHPLRKTLGLLAPGDPDALISQTVLALLHADVGRQAALISYGNNFLVIGLLSLLCVGLLLLIDEPKT